MDESWDMVLDTFIAYNHLQTVLKLLYNNLILNFEEISD